MYISYISMILSSSCFYASGVFNVSRLLLISKMKVSGKNKSEAHANGAAIFALDNYIRVVYASANVLSNFIRIFSSYFRHPSSSG